MSREYTQHPTAAKLFPAIDEKQCERIKADIKRHGQRESIKALGNQVVLGWHRYTICQELNIEPQIEQLPANTDIFGLVMSSDLMRRHLSKSQLAAKHALYDKHYRIKHPRGRPKGSKSKTGNRSELPPSRTKHSGLPSERFSRDARKLLDKNPQLHEKVLKGEMTLSEAMRRAGLKTKVQPSSSVPKKHTLITTTLPVNSDVKTSKLTPVNVAHYEKTVNDLVKWCPEWQTEFENFPGPSRIYQIILLVPKDASGDDGETNRREETNGTEDGHRMD